MRRDHCHTTPSRSETHDDDDNNIDAAVTSAALSYYVATEHCPVHRLVHLSFVGISFTYELGRRSIPAPPPPHPPLANLPMATPFDTVGSLLAGIATSLQDALRTLMFADKRGWGPDEFEQVRAVEEALDEAKRDFQAMGPLVNGAFYYENDRKLESLDELRVLRTQFAGHAATFRDWLRTGGPINPLWVNETVRLRRQLHRAQCRAARRIFNAEHEDGSGARCLGAFLVYRRLRAQQEANRRRRGQGQGQRQGRGQGQGPRGQHWDGGRDTVRRDTAAAPNHAPAWKQQQPRLQARELRDFAGREPYSNGTTNSKSHGYGFGRGQSWNGAVGDSDEHTVVLEMTTPVRDPRPPLPPLQPPPLKLNTTTADTTNSPAATTTIPLTPDELLPPPSSSLPPPLPRPPPPPPSPPRRSLTLEDLVPDCNAVGTFERFGDRDIAFICDYCDGHIVWEDVQRLPTTRAPPPPPSGIAAASVPAVSSLVDTSSSSSSYLPFTKPSTTVPLPTPLPPQPPPATTHVASDTDDADEYPRWQATTVAMSNPDEPRIIVFAPLAIANHLPPLAGGWEARLWCPYCDDYLYYDSAAGEQTKYAQDEYGFSDLAAFQDHLAWHHTALPLPALPALPTTNSKCLMM
ncbi:hypothetical protein SPI_00943 [Niveomyces insectorum RCEF 264]|uniref:Uncharacterized protein n=1 Tax=Niveomyces insectorum RCEF 264 TaxID=1081102 RepID=A0A168AHF2_9HYPO|nr:hypothetical protein SPI_00943 [Niveomyces insectorum RCEF 264]